MTMSISEVRKMPTVVSFISPGSSGVHESCVRSYQILDKVKYYLKEGVPAKVVLELIKEMESMDAVS